MLSGGVLQCRLGLAGRVFSTRTLLLDLLLMEKLSPSLHIMGYMEDPGGAKVEINLLTSLVDSGDVF